MVVPIFALEDLQKPVSAFSRILCLNRTKPHPVSVKIIKIPYFSLFIFIFQMWVIIALFFIPVTAFPLLEYTFLKISTIRFL